MTEPAEKTEKIIHSHTPKVFALRQPSDNACEIIITTTARTSHVFSLTYQQVCLLASQAEQARINWPKTEKPKPEKSKS